MDDQEKERSIQYRKLSAYKYQLREPFEMTTDIWPEQDIETPYMCLTIDGNLQVRKSYAWDGPSGPTIDTKTFLRASLVHDVLYQMMREEFLDYRVFRRSADALLKVMCLEDGMFVFRAWYIHLALRIFGETHARPVRKSESQKMTAP